MSSILGSGSVHHQGRRRMVSLSLLHKCLLVTACRGICLRVAMMLTRRHLCRRLSCPCALLCVAGEVHGVFWPERCMVLPLQAPSLGGGSAGLVCQRCLQTGHWTYECKNAPVYKSRPTRTQQLKQPKVRSIAQSLRACRCQIRDCCAWRGRTVGATPGLHQWQRHHSPPHR